MEHRGRRGAAPRYLSLRAWTGLICAMLTCGAGAQAPEAIPARYLAGFVDDTGHVVTDAPQGPPLRLLTFGYVSCPDVCPGTLVAIHQALVDLGPLAARVEPAFVTVDPDRDSVVVLHRYVGAFDPRIRGYRSNGATLQHLADELDVRYWREKTGDGPLAYGMNHTATLFLVARDGRVVATVPHYADPTTLSAAIVSVVRAASSGS